MIPPAEAQASALLLRNLEATLTRRLEQQRNLVTGQPQRLISEADLHAKHADALQRAYEAASAEVRGLARHWRGDDHIKFTHLGKVRLDALAAVVRGLRREKAWMWRCAVFLTRSKREVDALIQAFRGQADQVVGRATVVRYEPLARELVKHGKDGLLKARGVADRLAEVLAEAQSPFPQPARAGYTAASQDVLPEPKPQNPAGEFDTSIDMLITRIHKDTGSAAVNRIRDSYPPMKIEEFRRAFWPDGPLDTKPMFRRHWGMSARNDLFTPIPPELGTIEGRQAEMPYDLVGNIHYGYVGRAAGVSEFTIDKGAMAADLLYNRAIDHGDKIGVRIGLELYQKYPDPAQLRPEHLREAIRTHFDELFAVGKIQVR